MDKNLQFSSYYAGKRIGATGTSSYIYISYPYQDIELKQEQANSGDFGYFTGWYFVQNGYKVFQLSTEGYTNIEMYVSEQYFSSGWNITSTTLSFSEAQTQDVVNGLIKNNKRIYENNLLCSRYSSKLTAEQRKKLVKLQERLERRNNALLTSGTLTDEKQSYPKGFIVWYNNLKAIVSGEKIGVTVSATALIVIVAVVIASLVTAAYFAYKSYYDESVADVKFSDELTKTLQAKLTAEEYEQLKEETAGLLTKAKLQARFSALGSTAKTLLSVGLGVVGAYAAYKFIKKQ